MTLLTHGMSEELIDYGIGCNTLWPRTAIATAAVQNLLGGESVVNGSRLPDIMADAAYEILRSCSRSTNDKFFILSLKIKANFSLLLFPVGLF